MIVLPYSSTGPGWGGGGGDNPLYGLYGEVSLNMVRFSSSLSETGYMYIILRNSVLNDVHVLCAKQGMCFWKFFVLNRVGVSNPQRLTTQIFVEYPLLPSGTGRDRVSLRSVHADVDMYLGTGEILLRSG